MKLMKMIFKNPFKNKTLLLKLYNLKKRQILKIKSMSLLTLIIRIIHNLCTNSKSLLIQPLIVSNHLRWVITLFQKFLENVFF